MTDQLWPSIHFLKPMLQTSRMAKVWDPATKCRTDFKCGPQLNFVVPFPGIISSTSPFRMYMTTSWSADRQLFACIVNTFAEASAILEIQGSCVRQFAMMHTTLHITFWTNGSNLCLTTEAAACNSFWVPLQVSVEKETHGLWSTVAWPDIPPLSAGLSTIHQVYYGNLMWTIEHEIKRCCTLKGSHLWKMLHDDAIEELGAS